MEIPSPVAGVIREMKVAVGDQVSEGALIAMLEADEAADAASRAGPVARAVRREARRACTPAARPALAREPQAPAPHRRARPRRKHPCAGAARRRVAPPSSGGDPRASRSADPAALLPWRARCARTRSPSVRRLARELGVDLALVPGTGPQGPHPPRRRAGLREGVIAQGGAAGVPIAGVAVAAPLEIDFAKFGPTEIQPLNRIRRLSAANLHRSWVTVAARHAVRRGRHHRARRASAARRRQEAEARGVKLTFLPFLVKAGRARAAGVPALQRVARPHRREPDREALLPHRRRGRHRERAGRAGDARRRQEGPVRAGRRARGALRAGARAPPAPGATCRAAASASRASAASAARASRRS